jgi:pilus assembly protein CpaE
VLDGLGRVERLGGDVAEVMRAASILKPLLVFIDFVVTEQSVKSGSAPELVTQAFQRGFPDAVLIGVGDAKDPAMTLAALRSGVTDFVDLDNAPDDLRSVVKRLGERTSQSNRRADTVAIVGSRIGVGVSTLAAHLATLAMDGQAATRRVALIDLGLPVGDGLLYTNTMAGFDFADAVGGLTRLDETLVRSALPASPAGVNVLSLPSDLTRMRSLPQADAIMLVDRIRKYFDVVIIDLGGAGIPDLVASLMDLADVKLLMTDQSVGSVLSLTDVLNELEERSINKDDLRLVVNRYEEDYGLSAEQLRERFSLKAVATIPDRRLVLGRAALLGQLLVGSKQEPYIRALQRLWSVVIPEEDGASKSDARPWTNVTRFWRTRRS